MIFLGVHKHALDKAGMSLGYNEVKELQWKVITEVVSAVMSLLSYQKGFGSVLNSQSANITEPSIVSE